MTTIDKPITKIIKLTLNGFHGYQSHNVRATFSRRAGVEAELTPFGYTEEEESGYDVTITESAARKFSCRCECTCGEGVPTEFQCDEYDFEHGEITLNGNYPQQ